ncbi:cholinesterase-like isoform X2 [Dermacentor albipictus]|uniref:cholinesterase-like isoform X2 n=1 Tax=Dermacentor albipictus TaxID=60249 RepID=UPI0031FBD986
MFKWLHKDGSNDDAAKSLLPAAMSPLSMTQSPHTASTSMGGELPFTSGGNYRTALRGTVLGVTGHSAAQNTSGHVISEAAHSFWSMRSGRHSSHSYLRNVHTRDLAFLVALILAASFVALMLVVAFRGGQDGSDHVLAVGRFGVYYGTRAMVSGVAVGAFLGVPYADPRTLRFGAPVPWHREQEMFDNTSPAPSCAQTLPSLDEMNASTSEDCLHLNIWAPACGSRTCSGNRTVVVFIHGGFFQTGSNNDPHYDGRALAALGDVVVVVPNWRLGVLGFLSLARSDEVPINAGLLDQAEVLRWTARNVDAFGGNKSDLVVVGHGSGASALAYHLMLGHGLSDVAPILKVVFMSESPMTRYPVPNGGQESAQSEYPNASVRLLCEQNNSSLLSCLRRLPVEELLRRQRGDPRELPKFFPVLPVMWPTRLWKDLKMPRNVTVLLGFSEYEGPDLMHFFQRFFHLGGEPSLHEHVRSILMLLRFSSAEATAILDQYFEAQGAKNTSWLEQLLSDLLAVCPVRFYAERLRASGNNVHGYVLHCKNVNGQCIKPPRDYAARLLFGSPLVLDPSSFEEQALSRIVIARWAHFFKTGWLRPVIGSINQETIQVNMISLTKPASTWTPDLRKEACEKLRPYFSAFIE